MLALGSICIKLVWVQKYKHCAQPGWVGTLNRPKRPEPSSLPEPVTGSLVLLGCLCLSTQVNYLGTYIYLLNLRNQNRRGCTSMEDDVRGTQKQEKGKKQKIPSSQKKPIQHVAIDYTCMALTTWPPPLKFRAATHVHRSRLFQRSLCKERAR